ncbi:MAG: erythromycin biosynthesis sensory transduction protein eryC1 [Bacteroidetes bacterium RIFCSPLOWO2_02_FULL_36_8]|nr:MAG: erythromycin biosynthesis sensory transduction protein eryC1 [Bacteroidetes bacterium RIFCSPLOWO2_02_FULL_36_8]
MKIPFLDLKANYLSVKTEIWDEINQVLENTNYIMGPKVKAFEQKFASAHQVKHCHATSSGTDANHLVLWGLGITHGDEVILPANTFIATAWGATLCGAKPVLVDCEKDSYNIDPEKVEKAITPRTKAVVAVHLYGQPADIDSLKSIAKKHNLHLVEDAAQAHLAEYKGKKVGGLADAASFSFYPGKNLGAYGEGGAVTTQNDSLANTFNMMRQHGQSEKYHHQILGHNYRMEEIQGAVLGIKLKYLAKWTEKRRAVAARYRELLGDLEEITLPAKMSYANPVYHLFVIKTTMRDEMQKYLNEQGVSTGLHYPVPLHLQNTFQYLGHKKGDFPVSEKLAEQGLSLPMFPEMTDEQIGYVAEKVRSFCKAPVLS